MDIGHAPKPMHIWDFDNELVKNIECYEYIT